ncbi:MAG: hydroxyisourate hydrolase [Gammaproteobacteria bacterium]|nr:hydroxyisourate hydrolase [Gammaproteobacteria bacterium]
MGRLTTHVLDTTRGCPGSGISVELFRVGNIRTVVASAVTNDDGRCDSPLLEDTSFKAGVYELVFHAGDYLRRVGLAHNDPMFLDEVVIRFGISSDEHYHVPLLLSPFGYSTYRGS